MLKPPPDFGVIKDKALMIMCVHVYTSISRTFRIYDDDRSNTLSLEEFSEGLQDYGVRGLAKADIANLFAYFDRDGSGTINFNEFMIAIRVSRILKKYPIY